MAQFRGAKVIAKDDAPVHVGDVILTAAGEHLEVTCVSSASIVWFQCGHAFRDAENLERCPLCQPLVS